MAKPRKKKKQRSKRSPGGKQRWVRLDKASAMELLEMAKNESIASAERHLSAMRPELGPADVREVAMRCSNPGKYGGVRTGTDPIKGEYAELLICGQKA